MPLLVDPCWRAAISKGKALLTARAFWAETDSAFQNCQPPCINCKLLSFLFKVDRNKTKIMNNLNSMAMSKSKQNHEKLEKSGHLKTSTPPMLFKFCHQVFYWYSRDGDVDDDGCKAWRAWMMMMMDVKLGMGCFKAGRALSGGLKGCRCAGAASTSALCTVMLCTYALCTVHCTLCRSSKHLPSDPSFCNFWKEELSRFDWEGVAAPALLLSLSSLCSIFLHSSCF